MSGWNEQRRASWTTITIRKTIAEELKKIKGKSYDDIIEKIIIKNKNGQANITNN